MIKYFNEKNILFYKLLFPYTKYKKTKIAFDKKSVIVGIGGNVGHTYWVFKKIFNKFASHSKIKIISSSPVLKNPAFGFLDQDDFLNAIVILQTTLRAEEFLKYILNIEKALGRVRSFKNAPRVIDIDIIFFKNQKIKKNNLVVPHSEWKNRLSVILPLNLN